MNYYRQPNYNRPPMQNQPGMRDVPQAANPAIHGIPTQNPRLVTNTQAGVPTTGCIGDMGGFPLAMAYVPVQSFANVSDPHDALKNGTLFCDLKLDFTGR